jgi:hypothetical protein
MNVKHSIRNFFSPTKMLDTGYVDQYNALPSGKGDGDAVFTGSLMQYAANRFTRGSIRGQLFALLSDVAISERYKKSSRIKWH